VKYEITIEHIEPQRAAAMRATTVPAEIGPTLAKVLPTVGMQLHEQGVKAAGPPFCRYHEFTPERVELEGGITVQAPIRPTAEVRDIELPGGEVVTTVHTGPYTTLGDAWDALRAWLAGSGREPASAGWEVYMNDPGEVPDPKEYETKIFWPLR
jgi:effector-binding domain-containing protein